MPDNLGNEMNNAANLLDNIEETMSNASAEDIAKLAQQVQNDPATITRPGHCKA